MKKIKINVFLGYIVLVIVAGVTSIIGIFIANQIQSQKELIPVPIVVPTPSPKSEESKYPDYYVIKEGTKSGNIKSINITSDCSKEGCINSIPASLDFDGINKTYLVKGQFSRAYLYMQLLVDYEHPLTSWDDVFFSMNYVGGHLYIDDNSLPTPPIDPVTQLLFNLRSLSFYYTLDEKLAHRNLQANTNLFYLLQDNNTLNTIVTLLSDRPGRVLKQVSIYYECFEGSNCSIEEMK